MKNKIVWIGAVVFLAMVASAWAADVTGKWIAQVPGRDGASENTFNFKVEGTKLSGTVTTQQGETAISDGKVNGDEISFAVVRSMGGNEMKILWKGKVAGDEIKFTREFQGGMMGGPGGGAPPGGGAGGPGGGAGGRAGGGAGGGAGGPGGQEIIAKRAK